MIDATEYFKTCYKGISPLYYNNVYDEIYHLLNVAYDYEGNCVDKLAYTEARLKCLEAYKQLFPYREQIDSDVDELEGKNGFSFFYETEIEYTHAIQSMKEICLLAENKFGITSEEIKGFESYSMKSIQAQAEIADSRSSKSKGEIVNKEIHTFNVPLNVDEIEKLLKALKEKGFIHEDTKIENLAHVLGGPRPYDYKRIGWIKRSRNKTINKKSVLTFLRCLEVDWGDFTLQKLNYCFDVGKDFDYHNLKDSKSIKGNDGMNATSDAVQDLFEVMSMVFGEESERYKRIKKIPLMQNDL